MKMNETQEFFEQCGLTVEYLSVRIKKEEEERKVGLRILIPKGSVIRDFVTGLYYMLQHTRGEEQAFYRYVIRMLKVYFLFGTKEHVRKRRFHLETLVYPKKYSIFWEIFEGSSTINIRGVQRMKHVTGEVTESTTKLLQKAIFVKPHLNIPLSRKGYAGFRDMVLDEIEDIEPWMERKIEKEDEKRAEGKKEEIRTHEEIRKVKQKMFRQILKRARCLEENKARKYESIVQKADDLYKKNEKFALKGPQYLRKQLDVSELDSLLEELIELHETEHGIKIKPAGNVDSVDERKASEFKMSSIESFPIVNKQILRDLRHAQLTDDIKEKWDTLVGIRQNYVSRNECIALMQLEAESVLLGCMDYLMKAIYRKIRQKLTPPERRLFALMWFRYYPMLGSSPHWPFLGRICAHDPVIRGFFSGMDDETRGLILLVLACRIKTWKNQNLKEELDENWKAYLGFYPYWVDILRMDEAGRKKKERGRSTEEEVVKHTKAHPPYAGISFDTPFGDPGQTTLGDTIEYKEPPDPLFEPPGRSNFLDQIIDPEERRKYLVSRIEKNCTARQGEILKMRFIGKKMTEKEIAKRTVISQPAVHKHIVAGILNIRRGLTEKGTL